MSAVVRKAETTDVTPLSRALARAFYDDPVMSYLLPNDAKREKRLNALFDIELRYVHLAHEEVYTTSDLAGGALWGPPDNWRTPPASIVRALPRMFGALGTRIPMAMRFITAVEKVHPRQPHWYLAVLGTQPESQGKGVGSALLQPVLQRCDREGLPAYLESSKEQNIPFYRRHGFEVTGTIDLPGGGPKVWPMWREPKS